jgi:hypothetical protein
VKRVIGIHGVVADVNQHLQLLRSPAVFMLSYFVLSMFLVMRASLLYFNTGRILADYSAWKSCVFNNFSSGSDISDVCGPKPWRPVNHSIDVVYAGLIGSHTTIYFILFHRFKSHKTLQSAVFARLWRWTMFLLGCCGIGRRVLEKVYICLFGAVSWNQFVQRHSNISGKRMIVPVSMDSVQLHAGIPPASQPNMKESMSQEQPYGPCSDIENVGVPAGSDGVEDLMQIQGPVDPLDTNETNDEDEEGFSLAMQTAFTGHEHHAEYKQIADEMQGQPARQVNAPKHVGIQRGVTVDSSSSSEKDGNANMVSQTQQPVINILPRINSSASESNKVTTTNSNPNLLPQQTSLTAGQATQHQQLQSQSQAHTQTPKQSAFHSFFGSFIGQKATPQHQDPSILNMTIEVKGRTHKKERHIHQRQLSGGSSAGPISSGYGVSSITMSDGEYLAYNIIDDEEADGDIHVSQPNNFVQRTHAENGSSYHDSRITALQENDIEGGHHARYLVQANTQANSLPFSGSSAFMPRSLQQPTDNDVNVTTEYVNSKTVTVNTQQGVTASPQPLVYTQGDQESFHEVGSNNEAQTTQQSQAQSTTSNSGAEPAAASTIPFAHAIGASAFGKPKGRK